MTNIPVYGSLDAACRSCGVEPKDHGGSGFIAANVDGSRRGRGSGRIKFFRDNSGGYVKNWTDGRDALFFYDYREGAGLPRAELRRRMEELNRMRQEDEERRARVQANVGRMAADILAAAWPASLHPYLQRKRVADVEGAPCLEIDGGRAQNIVSAYPTADDGLVQRVDGFGARLLIVPMTVDTPAPVSLQLISAQGRKTFLKGGRVKGTVWRPTGFPVASDEVTEVGLCEGVATALSVRKMYGVTCLAGISAGNLLEATKTLRQCYPRAEILLFADRDRNQAGEKGARAAACAVARTRLFICPEFSVAERARFRELTGGDNPTDYNDLMISRS